MARTAEAVPPLFSRLIDDAGLFPPAALTMPTALRRHRDELAAGNPLLTGRFVCTLSHVEAHGRELADASLRFSLVVDGSDPDHLERLRRATTELGERVEAVEIDLALVPGPDELARIVDGVRRVSGLGEVYSEVGWPADLASRLAVLARSGARGKLRCGGVWESAFPSVAEVAAALVSVVELDMPWKATSGLHRAVRGVDPRDGVVHHGYLNLMLGTCAATDGASSARVAELVASGDAASLVAEARGLTEDQVTRTRASFVSYGSCDTREPLDELVDLGLAARSKAARSA